MKPHKALWVLVGLFVALSTGYMMVTPVLESPDESSHLQVIHYIATRHKLTALQIPEQTAKTGEGMAWLVSYHEEPLYYAPPLYHTLGALLTFWSPMDDLQARLIPNPAWERGWSPVRGTDAWNKNVFIHLPGETWRESPTVRTATVLRMFSLVCSVATLILGYHISLQILPQRRDIALCTAAVIALNPQFMASAVAVSNDPLTIALCSLGLLLLLLGLRLPEDQQLHHWLATGIVAGLACLVKQTGLMLLPLAGLTLLLHGWLDRQGNRFPWRRIITLGLYFGMIVLVICGWWYLRNAVLYSDPMGTSPHYATDVALDGFGLPELWDTFTSYWACFGWQVLNLPEWIYPLIMCVVVIGIGALIITVIRHRRTWVKDSSLWQPVLILAAYMGMHTIAFGRWAIATGAPYGRLLYASVVPISLLLSGGLHSFAVKCRTWIHRILSIAMIVLCALTPWLVIHPAFSSPIVNSELPKDLHAVDQRFTNGMTLLGYTEDNRAEYPGETMVLTLYWQTISTNETLVTNWAQFASLDARQRVAEDSRWLGGTLYPSAYWRTGDIVAQRIELNLPEYIDVPALYWLRTGLVWDDAAQTAIPQNNGSGYITLGPWEIRPQSQSHIKTKDCVAIYDESICLVDSQLAQSEDNLFITVTWQALAGSDADLTMFVHAINNDGTLVAQADSRPKGGAFPTVVWQQGDVITDTFVLDYSGAQHILVGWYNPITGVRLPAVNPLGDSLGPDQAVTFEIP